MSNLVTASGGKLDDPLKGKVGPKASKSRNTRHQMAVLRVLARYGMVPIQELATALGCDYQNAKKTAKILKDRGDVAWCRWYDLDNDDTVRGPKNLYHILTLTDRGHKRLVQSKNFPPDIAVLTRNWKGQSKRLPKMSHDRDVVKILIALHKALDVSEKLSLVHNYVEQVRHKRTIDEVQKAVSVALEILPNGKTMIADAINVLENVETGNRFTVFLEYENTCARSDMVKRINTKLTNYHTLFLNENRRFNEGQPLIFYVVAKKSRVSEIFKLDKVSPMLGVLRVAHIDDVLRDPLGKSWTRGSLEGGRFKLIPWSPVHG